MIDDVFKGLKKAQAIFEMVPWLYKARKGSQLKPLIYWSNKKKDPGLVSVETRTSISSSFWLFTLSSLLLHQAGVGQPISCSVLLHPVLRKAGQWALFPSLKAALSLKDVWDENKKQHWLKWDEPVVFYLPQQLQEWDLQTLETVIIETLITSSPTGDFSHLSTSYQCLSNYKIF